MSEDRLTKKEAYKLITSIVDDEVNEDIRSAFFEYIKTDSEVRSEFESIKKIKSLIASRCPCHKAPDRLKVRVQEFIFKELDKEDTHTVFLEKECESVLDIPSHFPSSTPEEEDSQNKIDEKTDSGVSSSLKWVYAAAASLLIIAVFWGALSVNQSVDTTYSIEEYVYEHFQKNDGRLVPPNISTASLTDAELSLSTDFDMRLTVPSLENAEFKGVAYSEFVPGFKAPLLEYYLPLEDQYIYIFAFEVNQLDQFEKLVRNQEAIKKCTNSSDFYIEDVNGKHVVSWLWNDIWYAAISNHNGQTLASLIKPLKDDVNSDD